MKTVELEQGSAEWLSWRKNKIGASEVPIILGLSPYSTPNALWKTKCGFESGVKETSAMRYGKETESNVREDLNQQLGMNFSPCVCVHPELEWAIASLDGVFQDRILEVKCSNAHNHRTAANNRVPKHYYPQVQWQLFVSGLDKGFYASYHKEEIELVEFELDEDYILKILPQITDFYHSLQVMEEPPMEESDSVPIRTPEFTEAAQKWRRWDETLSEAKEEEKKYRDLLISMTDDGNCHGGGVSLKKSYRKGLVSWKQLVSEASKKYPSLPNEFDPEKFRGERSICWRIKKM